MLYTIGHAGVYERLFDRSNNPTKQGKREDYDGGAVFHSKEEAEKHAPGGYNVYGIEATEDEVETNPEKPWDNLVSDSKLRRI